MTIPRTPAHKSESVVFSERLGIAAPAYRPHQLDDREWLTERYAEASDYVIAEELGCGASTVRDARNRLGIAGKRNRRGRIRVAPANRSLALLATYFDDDQRHHRPPTAETLIAAIKGWLDARKHRDKAAIEDALLSIASAALLAHQHQVKLRKAA